MPEILGWDAVGVVDAVGRDVKDLAVCDRVFYAGAINCPGTNAEYHLVDARIVGRAPATLSDAQAAALPLTAITAWELLFDRLGMPQGGGAGQSLLISGGAGGVGSILIQLARKLTQLTVIATASRPDTQSWCRELGAHYVKKPLDVMALKLKCLSLHWEMMFTRSLFQTTDIGAQGALLSQVAKLVDKGDVRTTLAETLTPLNAANLQKAHALIESGRVRGKIVLVGFDAPAS